MPGPAPRGRETERRGGEAWRGSLNVGSDGPWTGAGSRTRCRLVYGYRTIHRPRTGARSSMPPRPGTVRRRWQAVDRRRLYKWRLDGPAERSNRSSPKTSYRRRIRGEKPSSGPSGDERATCRPALSPQTPTRITESAGGRSSRSGPAPRSHPRRPFLSRNTRSASGLNPIR